MPNLDKAHLVVVGLGPGGLSAVLKAAFEGFTVLAISDRDEYIRPQRIHVDAETADFLLNYVDLDSAEDMKFFTHLSKGDTQVKELERFLLRKIQPYQNVQMIHLKKNEQIAFIKDENSHAIRLVSEHKVEHYPFIHLLAADGAKHIIADKISNEFNKPITYSRSNFQLRHEYHAAVQLKLKKGATPISPASEQDRVMHVSKEYIKQGWEEKDMPKSYILTNADKNKFSFVGEIPQCIHEEKNHSIKEAQLKSWAARVIFQEYGIKEDQLEFKFSQKNPESDKLRATTFRMNIFVCDKPLVRFYDHASQGVFAQIGDARRTPNYRIGHGANDAIAGGIEFVTCIHKDNFDFEENDFIQTINKFDQKVEQSMAISIQQSIAKESHLRQELSDSLQRLIDVLKQRGFKAQKLKDIHEHMNKTFTMNDLYDAMAYVEAKIDKPSLIKSIYQYVQSYYSRSYVDKEQIRENFQTVKKAMLDYFKEASADSVEEQTHMQKRTF